jgi:hypothetical protein
MAWGKAGYKTLDSANADMELTGLTDSKSNQIMIHTAGASTNSNVMLRLGNGSTNTDNNYAWRQCTVANNAEEIYDTQSSIMIGGGSGTHDKFVVGYICNISGEEKLTISHSINRRATGNNTPERSENVGKWTITNEPVIDTITANSSAGTFNSDSNISVLGSDLTPATTPAKIQDGLIFEETDTNKHYIYTASTDTWSEV